MTREEAKARLRAILDRDRTVQTVTLDIHSADFNRADGRLTELIVHLVQAKDFNDRDQLVVELRAGQQYLKAPRARRDLLEELIVRPLRRIKERAPTEQIGEIASEFLGWFLSNMPA